MIVLSDTSNKEDGESLDNPLGDSSFRMLYAGGRFREILVKCIH